MWMRGSLSDQDANHLAHLGVLDTARRPVGSGADLALELEQPLRTHATLQAHRIAQQLRAAESEKAESRVGERIEKRPKRSGTRLGKREQPAAQLAPSTWLEHHLGRQMRQRRAEQRQQPSHRRHERVGAQDVGELVRQRLVHGAQLGRERLLHALENP